MIYSSHNDFLFLKGIKVAGTSIEMALSGICGPDDIITPITPVDELARLATGGRGAQNYSRAPDQEHKYIERLKSATEADLEGIEPPRARYRNHMSFCYFVARYGCVPTKRIFCVERSPYAKLISAANMALALGRYRGTGAPMTNSLEDIRTRITRLISRGRFDCRNLFRYCDEKGNLVTRVLRFESLAEDFAALMHEYGISPAPTLPHAKKGIGSNEIDPREIFTREQLDRVNQVFAREFELFGYEPI